MYIPYAIRMVNNLQMIKTKNVGIIQAMEVVREMSLSRRLRLIYEAHLKAVRDRKAEDEYIMRISEERGEARGEARGKAYAITVLLNMLGDVPEELASKIRQVTDAGKQDELLKLAATSTSVEEFEKKAGL